MPFDPDTEIQYRKGGKIMKKTPRKFSAGGAAPAPTPKPAPKGGPKELQDEAEKLRQEKLDEAQRKAGQRRPNLGLKKGGKVKKFGEGGDVTQDTRERRADEKPRDEPAPIVNRTFPKSDVPESRDGRGASQLPQTQAERAGQDAIDAAKNAPEGYAGASSYAAQAKQDAPSGIKGGENVVTEVKKEAPKAPKPTAPKRVAPKAVAPKATAAKEEAKPTAKKATSGSDSAFKKKLDFAGEGDSNADTRQEGSRKRGIYERGAGPMLPSPTRLEAPGGATAFERRREERLQKEAKERMEARKNRTFASPAKEKDPYEGMSPSEKSMARGDAFKRMLGIKEGMKKGGVVKKYAKGGGVEAKGKTKGKIVKMATGGSVRGYGVSKVTNKTKYC
jgi:hypothetical protein